MATTGSNFIEVATTTLKGSAVTTAPYIETMGPKEASAIETGSGGSAVDKVEVNLALTAVPTVGTPHLTNDYYGKVLGGYAKNGCILLSLSGTTAQSIDFTDLTVNTPAGTAGDTTFATVSCLVYRNLGTTDLTLAPGASNPANAPKFSGTTPTITIPAGSVFVWHSNAPVTIDSTHKVNTITPTAGGTLAVSVGGS